MPASEAHHVLEKPQRPRAFVIIYAPLMLLAMFAFASLAVDWGRVQLTKTELGRAADAAARAGVSQLPNGVTAVETAVTNFAAKNTADSSNVVIDTTQDIDFGTWDSTAKTFTVLTGSNRTYANALRVTARRTAARGNAVPLVFAQAIGMATFDVQAASTVAVGGVTLDYSTGFSSATTMTYGGSAALNGSAARLTQAVSNQAGSAYNTARVPIRTFDTTFNFLVTSPVADGFCFVIQNNTATSRSGAGGGLAYSGVNNSIGIKFDLYSNAGEGTSSTGLYTNGATPQNVGSLTTTGASVNLRSAHLMTCRLVYDGTTLSQTITDTTTNAVFTTSYTIDIPTTIGSGTPYVGFVGATGGSSADQSIQNWTFSSTGSETLVR